jgi:hypothetical protein
VPGILSIGLTSWPLQRFFQLLLSWPDLITICSSTQSLLILAALHTARYPTAKYRTLNPLPDLLTSHSTNHSLKLLKKALVYSKQFAPLHGIKWENELWPNEAWDANFIRSVWKPPEVFSLDRSQTVFQKHDYWQQHRLPAFVLAAHPLFQQLPPVLANGATRLRLHVWE